MNSDRDRANALITCAARHQVDLFVSHLPIYTTKMINYVNQHYEIYKVNKKHAKPNWFIWIHVRHHKSIRHHDNRIFETHSDTQWYHFI